MWFIAVILYIRDEQADAAMKNPQLKLVFRLISFFILDEGKNTRTILYGY
jgi:hypothetical protein